MTTALTSDLITTTSFVGKNATTTDVMTAGTERSRILYHHPRVATLTMHSLTSKSTSSSVATKQPRAIDSNDPTQGRSTGKH
jgi:hypothetical protein